jgi:C4-dicarboxylate transporter, DctM subunit
VHSFWHASGEIALPFFVLICFFSGFATIVESAAFAVLYVLILEVAVHRDISLKNLPGVFLKAVPLVGGVLVILSAANAISYFMVDAEIPMQFADWCAAHVHSKYLFLLLLNVALLVVGSVIEIFSSILIIVPLLVPLGAAFGIDPVHLGIIFIANMELGYLMPPVGLNLLLASFRFEEPLLQVYKNIIPFLIALFVAVLIITYIPWITTWLPSIIKF